MNIKSIRKLNIILLLIFLIYFSFPFEGCQGEFEQLPATSSSSIFSAMLVPDTNLDLYVYCKNYSNVSFAVVTDPLIPDYDGDGDTITHFCFHNRYNDTWWNNHFYGIDGIYEVDVL